MKLGMTIDMSGPHPKLDMDRVLEAERLGFHQVWTGEAYSTDAVTPVAWILARTTKIKAGTGIMQMPARTPACAAMTVLSLQALSGNRFICGIGPSGPQVVEGWHGVPFGKPMQRTKEYIAIIKQVLAREKPLEFHGEHYDIPYKGPGASGLGRPLRSIAHGNPDVQFFMASITPAGLRTAGEVADGNLPIFFSPDMPQVVTGPTLEGRKKSGKTMEGFDNAPFVRAKMGPDLEACRDAIRPELALYIGGMGARTKNFYNDMVSAMGFEGEAKVIQDLYLDGKKNEAAGKVPDKLIDSISLVGSADRIRDRLQAWKAMEKDGHVGTMVLKGANADVMRVVAEAVL
ncbi:MAG: LLM class F420-dependent oxidoreductase [Acetobacteraceae bacterium]